MNPFTKKKTLKISLDYNAYSSGQIESKLWLCRNVEKLFSNHEPQVVWILGAWVGLLSFLLLSRERLNIRNIYSYDQDPYCEKIAYLLNENWVWKSSIFKAKTIDCNQLNYSPPVDEPDLIINTSVEHFYSRQWYFNIPKGKKVVLQSCDMKHKDHVYCIHSEEEFKEKFPSSKLYYSGSLKFNYPNWSFTRYMLILEK